MINLCLKYMIPLLKLNDYCSTTLLPSMLSVVVSRESMRRAGSADSVPVNAQPSVSAPRRAQSAFFDFGLRSDMRMTDLKSDSNSWRLMPFIMHLNCAQSHCDISVNTLKQSVVVDME